MRSNGADLIAAERSRQVEQEGWTPERDARYTGPELLRAAEAYLREAEFHIKYQGQPFDPRTGLDIEDERGFPASSWPWSDDSWKPSPDPVRNLVKAGALIAAEIDRLQATQ